MHGDAFSFALDVTLPRAHPGVDPFPCGQARLPAGIRPSSQPPSATDFVVSSGSNANWSISSYSPVAVAADNPGGTLPGLNSSGVPRVRRTLGSAMPASIPPLSGTLCSLKINRRECFPSGRTRVVADHRLAAELAISSVFTGALVGSDPQRTLQWRHYVRFQDGELESAPSVNGPLAGHRQYEWSVLSGGQAAVAGHVYRAFTPLTHPKNANSRLRRDLVRTASPPGAGLAATAIAPERPPAFGLLLGVAFVEKR